LYQYQPPYYNGFALTVFFEKHTPPTAFTPEPVRRKVAGMKQILLILAVVALVGCGKKPLDPIVEKAVRKSLEKPTGELTKADLEKVEYIGINAQLTEVPKGLEMLTKLKTLSLENNKLTDVKGLEKLTKLEGLVLSYNKLTDVKGLEKLTQLTKLYLGKNQLTDVKGLEKLIRLTQLSLENNRLTDVKGIEKLTHLTWLDLRDNPNLTKGQIHKLQKALPRCDILSNPKK
jgi:internalin A